jgi:hypothetical protein
MGGEAVGKPVQNVADHGARRRGHHANHAGQEGQRLLARCVKQALGGELPRCSSSAISAPMPAGSSASMTI